LCFTLLGFRIIAESVGAFIKQMDNLESGIKLVQRQYHKLLVKSMNRFCKTILGDKYEG